ncbi:MAG: hypothetical protein ABIJ31_13935 [Pseudomonadota bacterium]
MNHLRDILIEKRDGSDTVIQTYSYDQKNRITSLADQSGTHTFAHMIPMIIC